MKFHCLVLIPDRVSHNSKTARNTENLQCDTPVRSIYITLYITLFGIRFGNSEGVYHICSFTLYGCLMQKLSQMTDGHKIEVCPNKSNNHVMIGLAVHESYQLNFLWGPNWGCSLGCQQTFRAFLYLGCSGFCWHQGYSVWILKGDKVMPKSSHHPRRISTKHRIISSSKISHPLQQ